MKKYQKIALGILISIIAVIAVFQIFISFYLDTQIQQLAEKRFKTATNGNYKLEISDLDFTLLGRRLEVSDIRLKKKKTTNSKLRATVDDLRISGIRYRKLLFHGKLVFNDIAIINPKINYTSSQKDTKKSSDNNFKWSNVTQKISEITLQITKKIRIPELNIRGLSVTYNKKDAPVKPYFSVQDSDITLIETSVDSSSLKDKRILPSKDIITSFNDIQFNTANKLYKLSVDKLTFASKDSTIALQSLKTIPRLSKKQFADQFEYEFNRMNFKLDSIHINQLDPNKLNKAQGFKAGNIKLSSPDFSILRDKTPPFPPNKSPALPQQMLHNIPFPLSIDSVLINNGEIKFSQRRPQSDDIGYVSFTNLSAKFVNLTNVPDQLEKNGPPTLNTQADVMGKGRLDVEFIFPMHNLKQHINGTLPAMDMRPLNKALIPMAFVQIDNGKILDLNFDMTLNKEQSSGTVKLLYKDLKISLLKKKSKKETLGKKMMSFLANVIKVKSKNIGNDPRIGKVDFERVERKSTFHYWWKSLLSGLKPSVGL